MTFSPSPCPSDADDLLKDFSKSAQKHDPVIHFYETFLSEYDPVLRKSRSVWYTPEPVVKFIRPPAKLNF